MKALEAIQDEIKTILESNQNEWRVLSTEAVQAEDRQRRRLKIEHNHKRLWELLQTKWALEAESVSRQKMT